MTTTTKHATTVERTPANGYQATCTSCGPVGPTSYYEWTAATVAERHTENGVAVTRRP